MLRVASFALIGTLLLLPLLGEAAAYRQRREYFTELEINDIQLSQEIDDRTTVLLWIADRRLLELNPPEPDAEEGDGEPGFGVTVGNAIMRILNPEGAAELDRVDAERAELEDDLSTHTRADLLRGYVQALEETMDNIDDAYERNRGDVREPIAMLRSFSEQALVTLQELDASSDGESRALDDAIEQTELVIDG
jgi:hypothetical protein